MNTKVTLYNSNSNEGRPVMMQILIIVFGALLCIGGAIGIEKRKFKISASRPIGGSGAILLNLFTLLFGLAAIIYALGFLPK